jgi:transcriptional regulator with GAF, ATPase, and Fis domain
MAEIDELKGRCQELEALFELASELLHLEDSEAILDTLVQRSLAILRADRGFVVIGGPDSFEFKVVRNWSREDLEERPDAISRSIVADVLRQGEPLLVRDALSDRRYAAFESVTNLRIRSVLAAPLQVEGEPIGVLYIESGSNNRLLMPRHLELFKRILQLSSQALQSCMRRILLEQRNAMLETDLLARHRFPGIVTRDPDLLKVLETIAQVAATDMPVLVQGPSGSGKELIVRALHLNSKRASRPLLTINCGAISPHLLESELFGHVRGAFTGALSNKVGLIPSAHRGTIFLDEVGELPRELQVKLLRTLQFGEVQPIGSVQTQVVDVRFVSATNRDLERDVREGRFREDLLYRLNVVPIELPPLKKRPDDILLLFYHFLKREAHGAGRPVPSVTPQMERALQQYGWPGNVRELENEVRRLLALAPPGAPLTADRLARRITAVGPSARPAGRLGGLAEQEKELIEMHLRLSGGNRTRAAESLGISRDGLRKMMKRYGIGE